jgi:outer membrane receptor protein involved in Fe transport
MLGWTVAAFFIDWDDQQLSLFDPVAGGYIDNVGASTSRGVDAELSAQVTESLALFGGFGYTKTEFEEYTDPFGNNVEGNSLPFAPETTWNVGAQLGGDFTPETGWFARAEYIGVGEFFYDANNTESESYELVNLRAGVTHRDWRLSLWVRNLFEDEYFPVAVQPNPADPTFFVAESGEPRVFGVTLGASF